MNLSASFMLSRAAEDVLRERAEQITREGFTPKHDDTHREGELSLAALFYLLAVAWCNRSYAPSYLGSTPTVRGYDWPWAKSWWKPGRIRRMLVKAAALIIAEIERIDRAEALYIARAEAADKGRRDFYHQKVAGMGGDA
jgi:hypothetical protein